MYQPGCCPLINLLQEPLEGSYFHSLYHPTIAHLKSLKSVFLERKSIRTKQKGMIISYAFKR